MSSCKNKYYAKGYCQKHYDKLRRKGNPNFERDLKNKKPCAAGDCIKKVFANSLCPMHNRRLQRHGDPNFINPKCNRDGLAKERSKNYRSQWKKDNWNTYKYYLASRKKRVKQATPKWANLKEIQRFYKDCPKGHHVDHIIPINGLNVSGLHVLNNLQYLQAIDNLKKSNKF